MTSELKRSLRCSGLVALFSVLAWALPSPAAAQVPWDSPLLIGPGSPGGVSLFLVDPGQGLGFMGQWRGKGSSRRMGFRAGLAEDHGDDLVAFGGVDFTGPILHASDEFPLDMIWVTGAGLGVGDHSVLSIPIGVALGIEVTENDVWFHPYFAPRLIFDAFLGDDDPHRHGEDDLHRHNDSDLELGFALDFGADFAFAGDWALRIGASVGDRDGLAIGFSLPGWR
jgi:hypothetical protein